MKTKCSASAPSCINCSILMRHLRRYPLNKVNDNVYNTLRKWVAPTPISRDDFLCPECLVCLENALQDGPDGVATPKFGHRSVCFLCGTSTLRKQITKVRPECEERRFIEDLIDPHLVPHLQSVCYVCWKVVQRQVQLYLERDGTYSNLDADDAEMVPAGVAPCESVLSEATYDSIHDEVKAVIVKVYHYLEREYTSLKSKYGDLVEVEPPLCNIAQRTAHATGVSEEQLRQMLLEEKEQIEKESEGSSTQGDTAGPERQNKRKERDGVGSGRLVRKKKRKEKDGVGTGGLLRKKKWKEKDGVGNGGLLRKKKRKKMRSESSCSTASEDSIIRDKVTEHDEPSEHTEHDEASEQTEYDKPSEQIEHDKPSEQTEHDEPSASTQHSKPAEHNEQSILAEHHEPTDPTKPSEHNEPSEHIADSENSQSVIETYIIKEEIESETEGDPPQKEHSVWLIVKTEHEDQQHDS